MDLEKLNKHYNEFEAFLERSKKPFENRIKIDFNPNATFEDFQIIRTLDVGRFGRVLLTKHKQFDNRLFAIKMVEKQLIVKEKQIEHMMNEIRILDAINFEFIINLEFYFSNNVYLFITMPFIPGGSLFVHLRKMKKFNETLSKFYAAQVVLALEYLHYLGLIYRDLKPENLLIDDDGYIKITAFGFCKKIDDARTYTLCGTPDYIAPEIILAQGYNKSVDYWSLGVLIFEMTSGYPPFYSKDPLKIYENILAANYPTPWHFSRAIQDLIKNLLQVDRSKR